MNCEHFWIGHRLSAFLKTTACHKVFNVVAIFGIKNWNQVPNVKIKLDLA